MRFYLISFFLLMQLNSFGQKDPESQYKFGYELFIEGKYDLAMEVFKPLSSHNHKFKYREEAAYYYSLAAKEAGYFYQARQMMVHSVTQFKDWEHLDNSYLLLSELYFLQNDHLNACLTLKNLQKETSLAQGRNMKFDYLSRLSDSDSLKQLYYSFPEDKIIGILLAENLSKPPFAPGDEALLESLIEFFHLNPENFNMATAQVYKKDAYNVAVLLPFKWKLTQVNNQYFKNKFAYSIYSGILRAVDTLVGSGIDVRIRPYDTEQSIEKTQSLLEDSSLTQADLIIGPMYPHLSRIVMDFGRKNTINVVNPLSKNMNMVEGNPYGYLFQVPELISGARLIQLAKDSLWYDSLSCPSIIINDPEKDSILVSQYFEAFKEDTTFRIDSLILFDPSNLTQIDNYIHRDTLDSISISMIFLPSNNRALAGRVLRAADKVNGHFPILGHPAWAEYSNVSYDLLENRKVYFVWGDWLRWDDELFWLLYKEPRFDQKPDYYTSLGFEMMYFFGNRLNKYGRYFQKGLIEEGPSSGIFFPGFDFSKGNYNSFTPLIRVHDNQLQWLNKLELFGRN